ncbi:MAG: hypothetical protein ACRD2L_07860 [Terriglobia bacterium]
MAAKERNALVASEDVDGGVAEDRTSAPQLFMNELGGANTLDKVRDILFGGQAREFERHFARMEDRLTKMAAELREDLKKGIDALETYAKKEVDALYDRIRAESTEHGAAVKTLSQDLQTASETATQKLNQCDEQTNKQFRELRAQLLEQSRTQSEDLRQKYTELTAAFEHAIQDLRSNKTDRAGLAALFTEAAVRLQNEFRLPGNE